MFSFGTMKRESKWCAFARNRNFHHAAEQFNFSFNYNQVMENSHSYELTNLINEFKKLAGKPFYTPSNSEISFNKR